MSTRQCLNVLCWGCVFAFAILIFSPSAFYAAAQGSTYHVIRTMHLGGEGGWDYVTVDLDAKRIYIPRSTRIQVVDEDSGKRIGDIPGMNELHGVALVPALNREFVTANKSEKEAPSTFWI